MHLFHDSPIICKSFVIISLPLIVCVMLKTHYISYNTYASDKEMQ